MAIIEHKTSNSNNSLKKEIDESSMFMIYDVLQGALYNKPIQSSIRESVSNSFDSVKEKNIAKKIIKGEAKVEDYYSTSDDISTSDSSFDKDYYDLNFLSSNNTVEILYKMNNDPNGRDEIKFTDFGVGLGGERLIGWTKLGYSTKRLSNQLLGGFGLK